MIADGIGGFLLLRATKFEVVPLPQTWLGRFSILEPAALPPKLPIILVVILLGMEAAFFEAFAADGTILKGVRTEEASRAFGGKRSIEALIRGPTRAEVGGRCS